jgi:Kelch motif
LITLGGSGFSNNTTASLNQTIDLLTLFGGNTQLQAQVDPSIASGNYAISVHTNTSFSNSLPLNVVPNMQLIPTAAVWAPNSAHTLRAKVMGINTGLSVTWTASGGTIDPTGTFDSLTGYSFSTFIAPATPGVYSVTATSGTMNATASVTVSAGANAFSGTAACSPHGQDFTETELPSGLIALLGGDNGNAVNEAFNPASNSCTSVAAFIQGRYQHGAIAVKTGINAGKLLACGGFLANTGAVLDSCELFDPAANSWSVGPKLPLPMRNFSIGTLANGDIFFAGGNTSGATAVYSAATGTFKSGCMLTAPRLLPGVGTLPSGKVLIAGGATSDGVKAVSSTATAELYDPATNTCSAIGSMMVPRQSPNLTVLQDGRAIVSGTAIEGAETPWIEAYTESTGRFTVLGQKQLNVCCFSQSLLPNGKLLLSGGIFEAEITSQSEIFDPLSGTAVGTDNQKTARFLQKAITNSAGTVLQFGGFTPSTTPPSTGEQFK